MEMLADFSYMDIMSYFLYFSVFFKIRMEVKVNGNSVPVEKL